MIEVYCKKKILLVASCCRNRDKLRPDGHLTRMQTHFTFKEVNTM